MNRITLAAAALLAFARSLPGDQIVSATGTFSSFPSGFASSTPPWVSFATAPENTPFWNNPSADTGAGGSHMMNAGYLLSGTGGLSGAASVLGADTVTGNFTTSTGDDPSAFDFLSTATAYNIALLFADSDMNTGNASHGTVFGYYSGSTFTPLYTPLDSTSPAPAIPFDPMASGNTYGFYATVCYTANDCETYTTGKGNSGTVNGSAGWNHFALFELASGSYVIAFEDEAEYGGEGFGDFNDIVVELKTVTTPEPGTIAVMGAGLALLWIGQRYLVRRGTRCSGSSC